MEIMAAVHGRYRNGRHFFYASEYLCLSRTHGNLYFLSLSNAANQSAQHHSRLFNWIYGFTWNLFQVGGRSIVCKDVEQHVVVLEEEQKFLKLLELLGIFQPQGGVIVFVDKQENADELLKDLMKASYPCMSLHGGIDQFDRDSTIVDFKSGKVKLLVSASSVLVSRQKYKSVVSIQSSPRIVDRYY